MLELRVDSSRLVLRVAPTRALEGEAPQMLIGGLTGRKREIGEAVAEIGERELAALGDLARVAQRFGQIPKQLAHFGGRLQMTFRVRRQLRPGRVERELLADAGEYVE